MTDDENANQASAGATTGGQGANQAGSGLNSGSRVGGLDDNRVPWVGGSSLPSMKNEEPQDVLCHSPSAFKEKLMQHSDLKKGIAEDQKLDFVDGNKTRVGLTMWITWVTMMWVQKGMDTVFKILTDSDTNELDLLESWGKATKKQVKEWVEHLQGNFGDKFDKDNLKLSAHALRNSMDQIFWCM